MDLNFEKEFERIEEKHRDIIDISKKIMEKVEDPKHSTPHIDSVVRYTKEILQHEENADKEVCIVSAYWHDVGRLYIEKGHAELSAEMLEKQMKELNYDDEFIFKCSSAVKDHGWKKTPETLEGIIIRDADKIDFVGTSRWETCIKSNCKFKKILELLPVVRKDILKLEVSKEIFDREIGLLIRYLHDIIFKVEE